jgi:hypothetical protein
MRQTSYPMIAGMIFAASFFMTSCDSVDNSSSDQTAQIRILLTDAPAREIASATVTISRIEIVGTDDVVQTLSETAQEFDLLTLQNGTTAVLVDTPLNLGVYSYLRLFVEEDAQVVYLDNGEEAGLTIPSGFESGVKILLNDVALDNETDVEMLTLTLDFNVQESFVDAGESGMLIFKPVVKVKQADVNGEELLVE